MNYPSTPVSGLIDSVLISQFSIIIAKPDSTLPQIKMLVTNNALLPSEEEPSSRPWMWPVNWKGLWFALSHQHGGVYFLGGYFTEHRLNLQRYVISRKTICNLSPEMITYSSTVQTA